MHYFAYGSNMSVARLQARIPAPRLIGRATLTRHDLRFHKIGQDGSGKCDAFATGRNSDAVEGVVFEIDSASLVILDRFEGLGKGYDRKQMLVRDALGRQLDTSTYVATRIDTSLRPFSWYKVHVLVGAREANLSREYRVRIDKVQAISDPIRSREHRELAIHQPADSG